MFHTTVERIDPIYSESVSTEERDPIEGWLPDPFRLLLSPIRLQRNRTGTPGGHQKRVDPEPIDEHKVTLQLDFTAKPSQEQLETLARELNDVMERNTLGVTAVQCKGMAPLEKSGMAPVEKPSTAPVEKAGTAKGEESQRLIDF